MTPEVTPMPRRSEIEPLFNGVWLNPRWTKSVTYIHRVSNFRHYPAQVFLSFHFRIAFYTRLIVLLLFSEAIVIVPTSFKDVSFASSTGGHMELCVYKAGGSGQDGTVDVEKL